MRKNNKLIAFTLLEVVITLSICCSLIMIGSLQLRRYQERLIFDNTVREVTTFMDQASKTSTLEKRNISIRYWPKDHRIDVGNRKQLFLNSAIKITGLNGFRFNDDGSSSPATVTFQGLGYSKQVKYQMLWGRIRS